MKTLIYYQNKKPLVYDKDTIFFQYKKEWDHPSGGYGNLDGLSKLKPHTKRLRFYHSYWSKPALTANRWQVRNQHYLSLIYTAVSVYALKALGQEIVLHTDKAGAELLGCLPYDAIYIDLENNKAPINFWASGKFVSVINGETGIHIDTDLFITDPKTIDILADNDIVLTHFEDTHAYKDTIKMYLDLFNTFGIKHPFNHTETSVNCGIIKLPETIKKQYVNYYFKFVNDFNNNSYLKEASSIEKQSLYAPDLLIEQLLLKNLLDFKNVDASVILDIKKLYNRTKHQNICHLLSFEKYILIPHMTHWLKIYAPDLWVTVSNKLNTMGFVIITDY